MLTERERRARKRRWRKRWRRVKRTRNSTWVLLGGLAMALMFGGFVVWSVSQSSPSAADVAPISETEAPDVRSVLVVGDSWTTGGTMNDGPEWPALMDLPVGWNVLTDAMGGSGYIGDVEDGGLEDAGRLANVLDDYRPDVVLVALGRNDVEAPVEEVAAEARRAVGKMQNAWPNARVVMFSPFSPEEPRPQTIALTSALSDVADQLGVPYLDVSTLAADDPSLIAEKHPTDAGHAAIAAWVGRRLDALGVFG